MSYEVTTDLGTKTIASSGSETYGPIEVGDDETVSIVLSGDSNSNDITVDYRGNAQSGATFGDMQRARQTGNNFKRANLDLTSNANNKLILVEVPVGGLNQMEVEVSNGGGSSTDVQVKSATADIA
jgi:hypothetical protein